MGDGKGGTRGAGTAEETPSSSLQGISGPPGTQGTPGAPGDPGERVSGVHPSHWGSRKEQRGRQDGLGAMRVRSAGAPTAPEHVQSSIVTHQRSPIPSLGITAMPIVPESKEKALCAWTKVPFFLLALQSSNSIRLEPGDYGASPQIGRLERA